MADETPHTDPADIARERRAAIDRKLRNAVACDELARGTIDPMTELKWVLGGVASRVDAICIHLNLRDPEPTAGDPE